jgi:HEAT repeat protein
MKLALRRGARMLAAVALTGIAARVAAADEVRASPAAVTETACVPDWLVPGSGLRELDALLARASRAGPGDDDLVATLEGLGPSHASTLAHALLDPRVEPETRAGVAIALGRLRVPATIPALARAVADREESVAAEAVNALAAFGPAGRPAHGILERVLGGARGAGLRTACATALGRLGDPESASALVDALADESGAVRSEARASLASVVPRPAPPGVLARLDALASRATSEDARVEAVRCLIALADPQTVSVIVPYTRLGACEAVRTVALDGLGPIADEGARDAIVAALGDPSPRVREAACAAAGDLPGSLVRAALPALIERLKDTTAVARAAHDALERATGAALPESYIVWREWLASEREGGSE